MSGPLDGEARGLAGRLRSLRPAPRGPMRSLVGAAMVAAGLLILTGVIDVPHGLGTLLIATGASAAWPGDARAAPMEASHLQPLSDAQREVLAATMAREGREAAVRQLMAWRGSFDAEATAVIDAAFPEQEAGRRP